MNYPAIMFFYIVTFFFPTTKNYSITIQKKKKYYSISDSESTKPKDNPNIKIPFSEKYK